MSKLEEIKAQYARWHCSDNGFEIVGWLIARVEELEQENHFLKAEISYLSPLK